jgi:HSP20 family protein
MDEKRSSQIRTGQQQGERGLERSSRPMARSGQRDPFGAGPFSMMRRMQEDMDRLFNSFGFGRSLMSPFGEREQGDWAPAIDAFQRGNEFIVRADVPGLSKEDVSVEIGDDALTIRGERKYDHEEEREGYYRSERSYGSFCRVVPLPEGAVAESATASFKDGVLEISVQAPSHEVRRGRRIEIAEGKPEKPEKR